MSDSIRRPEGRAGGGEGRRLLVVDDDRAVLGATSALLQMRGWAVTGAVDGAEAIEGVSADPDRWTGVVIDYLLPDMSGAKLFHRLRAIRPDLPIVICSGMDLDPSDLANLRGRFAFLRKPYRLEDLDRTLRDVLAHRDDLLGEGLEKRA